MEGGRGEGRRKGGMRGGRKGGSKGRRREGTRAKPGNQLVSTYIHLYTLYTYILIYLYTLSFGTLAIPFTPLCQCLSEETLLKAAGPSIWCLCQGARINFQTELVNGELSGAKWYLVTQ